MRLYLVRHGEAQWNAERRFMGQEDSPLTARGKAQAVAVAERFRDEAVDLLVSSDLGRARSTASRIGDSCGRDVHLDPRLRERHVGVLQGLRVEEAKERFPDAFAELRQLGASFRIPGGESAEQIEARLQSFLDEMCTYSPETTVVAVTHGAILMTFLRMVLSIPRGAETRVAFSNTCICELQSGLGVWELHRWNDTCHLGALDDGIGCADRAHGLRSADGTKI